MPPQIPDSIEWKTLRVTATDTGDELSSYLQSLSSDGYTVFAVTASPQRNLFRIVAYKQVTP